MYESLRRLSGRVGSAAAHFKEAERGRQLEAALQREQHLNYILTELEQIELKAPICRLPSDVEHYEQRRALLTFERDLLRGVP
jgi:hypothetical protein